MKLIESKTLASTASTIEFTAIPQTYTDLVLLVSLRGQVGADTTPTELRFNGSTTGYSGRGLEGSSVSTYSYTLTYLYPTAGNGANTTANTFSSASVYIPNYAGSTNKSISVDGVVESNNTNGYQSIQAGLWSNTAAITSLAILTSSVFVVGCTVSLYGILKGSDGIVTTS
jgi:hypothetical protein